MKKIVVLVIVIFLLSCGEQFIVNGNLRDKQRKKDIVAAIVAVLSENGYSASMANENLGIVNSAWKANYLKRRKLNFTFDEQKYLIKMIPHYQIRTGTNEENQNAIWRNYRMSDELKKEFEKILNQIAKRLDTSVTIKWVRVGS